MPTDHEMARAVWIERFGGPEVVQVTQVPVPGLVASEVLVRTNVASINPVDVKTYEGKYPPMGEGKLPFVLGRDLAGEIEAIGPGVGAWLVGDRVAAFIGTDRGAQSELVVVKVEELVHVPDGIDTRTAGAVPLVAMTAWQGLFDHGGLAAGQRVLIHGGAGGVGHMAVQFAKWKGATVIATASAQDLDFVRSLGADAVVDYKNDRFEDAATDMDMVFDTQGGETQARSFGVLKKEGILVSTLQPDEKKAAEMGVRAVPHWQAAPNAAELDQVLRLIADGRVRVEIARSFPLGQVRDAQRFLREEHPRGKVILEIGE